MTTSNVNPVAFVVNDDLTQLNILAGLLRKQGIEVHSFLSAEAALAVMKPERPPDLIVTDLYMPGIDGWRFCRLLRSPEYVAFNQTPILVVSATFAGDEPSRIAADLGANAFLPSPVDGRRFVAAAQSLLSGEQLKEQLRVLIVEDSTSLASLFKKAFVAHGYLVDTVVTVQEALDAFSRTVYDVAVLDYYLPDGTGDILLDTFRIRQPYCVCLMMTSETEPKLALDMMKRGAAAFLRKPFDPEYLVVLCVRACRERALLRAQDLLEVRTRELRASEERFRFITQNAFDLVALLDEQGCYLFCNNAYLTILGYSPDELVGRNCLGLVHPDERDNAMQILRDGLADNRQSETFLLRIVHRDGHVRQVQYHAGLLRDGKGARQILLNGRDVTVQRQAEEELMLVHDRMTTVINSIDALVYIADMETHEILFINNFGSRAFGGNVIGQKCWQVLQRNMEGPCPFCTNDKLLDQAGKPAGVWAWECQNTTNGCWYDCRDTVVRWTDGRLVRMEIATDITERKRAEEALQASEGKYHGLFSLLRLMADTMPDMLWAKDLNKEYLFANKAVCQHLLNARDTAEPIGKNGEYFAQRERDAHPENPLWHTFDELCLDSDATTLQEMREMQFEECGNVKGQLLCLDVHKAPLFNAEGTLIGVVGSARDITERKRVEAEREQLVLAIEQTSETIIITDTEGGILYVNPAFERLTGYTAQEVQGKKPSILKSGEHDEDFYRTMWETLRRGEAWSGRVVNRRKNGTFFTEEAVISPVRNTAGQTVSYVAVKRDVTSEIRLEEQLRQAQKMESVGRLAGGVAHDFNNMLGVILGRAELALARVNPSDPLHADLEDIRQAGERSADLTRQLLAFARKQTVTPKVLDLNATVADMLKMVQRLLGEDIELVWQPEADVWPVKIDPSQVDQILANLCVNARDAIEGVGRIVISTGNCSVAGRSHAGYLDLEAGDYVRLVVSDNGCGIAREMLPHIFEPFFTTKGAGKGTGLGLATIYGVIQQNNGSIDVRSEPGQGTIFTLYLPRHLAKAEQAAASDSPQSAAIGHETILLVEDEPLILQMTTDMLELQGYVVRAAETPGKAIRLAQENPGRIDLLMTDVVMPEMNGRDLARSLLVLYPDLKRLFMSGYTADVIAHHGVLNEGVHFIQKPFLMKELAAKVREALDAENKFDSGR